MKRVLYSIFILAQLSCSNPTVNLTPTAAAQTTTFTETFNAVKVRWDTALNALNERLEYCDTVQKENEFKLPSKEELASQGLSQRQFELSIYILYRELHQTCLQDAYYKAAYELGVYNNFIHENLDEIQANGLLPDPEFRTWNDYTGHAEIIFEEDLLKIQKLRDEVGPLTKPQDFYIRQVVNNRLFDLLKFSTDVNRVPN